MIKTRDSAIAELSSLQRKVKTLKASVHLLPDELGSLKRCESTHGNLEVMSRKLASAQSDITDMVTGVHRDTVRSYGFIRRRVDEVLVKASSRLKEAFDRETRCLQQGVRDAVRIAAEETCGSFANASVAIGKMLGVSFGRTAGTRKSAKPGALLSHSKSRGAQACASSSRLSSGHGPRKKAPKKAGSSSSGAHDPGVQSKYGA